MSCSFCNSTSHNVRDCQNPAIGILHERIKEMYLSVMNQYPLEIYVRFKALITRLFNLRELKVVCATYTTFPISRTKTEIIESLYQYYSSRIYISEERRLPTQPDPIPDFARYLIEEDEEEEPTIINWYIDRTPSYIIQPQIKFNICPILNKEEVTECVEECSICYESVTGIDMVKLNCSHNFCWDCINGSLKARNTHCALCRRKIETLSVKNPDIFNKMNEINF